MLNPQGKNHHTYRRDFERTIDRLLAGVATEAEIKQTQIPEHIRESIIPQTTRAEVIARVFVYGAEAGPRLLV